MPRLTQKFVRVAATAGALALMMAAAGTAYADHGGGGGGDGGGGGGDGGGNAAPVGKVTVINQVADQSGNAPLADANLLNPWGLAISPSGGALWVANNNTNTATLYTGGLSGAAATKASLIVSIPGGKPTGQTFSGGSDFVVTGSGGSGPARFLFSSDRGDITAWNPTADKTNAIAEAHTSGAIYRSLTLTSTSSGDFLLAGDFHNNRIDIFDSTFKKVTPAAGQFVDRNLPSGYAPFNVQAIGSSVYVAYALQDSNKSMPQSNGGIVDVYTNFGASVSRIATNGTLRAPWGLAIAPSTFGSISGDLLVGNFHDGAINVFQGSTFVGQLANQNGQIIQIDELWALVPGNAVSGGTGVLWFSAGPSDGGHGLVGQLSP